MNTIADTIRDEILTWPGVTAAPHRFGGIEFRANHREIGHLHGNRQADLPFPVRVRRELIASGRASRHHLLPETGWVTFYVRSPEDVPRVLELFRLNYELVTGRSGSPSPEP